MKLLVPTDFSNLSKIAVKYAIALSQDLELDMVLLHVNNAAMPTMARLSSHKLEEAIQLSSENDMDEFMASIRSEYAHDLKIEPVIIYDDYIDKGVELYAIAHDIDLICIGTKGATGLKKILFGTHAAAIISNSTIPVLTIPEYARYKGIRNIVYSCDLENLEDELKRLTPYARKLNAEVHILHINENDSDYNKYLKDREHELRAFVSYNKIHAKMVEHDSVIEGINDYVTQVEADLIAMFTHHTSLIEHLFHKSVTKTEAFQTETPMLTFQKV